VSFTLNTNTSARIAGHHASQAYIAMGKSIARLSAGRKLQTPGDDSGGFSLSYKLSSRTFRTEVVAQNAQNAISCLQVQDGALNSLGEILNRFGELRTMAQDVTKKSSDIQSYNYEFIELQREFDSISLETFNDVSLFVVGKPGFSVDREVGALIDDDAQWGGQAVPFDKFSRNLSLHPSSDPNSGSISISMVNFDFIMAVNLGAVNPNYLTREPNGEEYINNILAISIGQIINVLGKVSSARAENGTEQNAVRKYNYLLQANLTNLETATGRIVDADMAKESTQLAKHKILSEISISMNGQANRLNYLGLSLIGVN
jgi:flagellin